MSVKYRIRLKTDRVIGPFSIEEIGELYLKNHIDGKENCQQFPIGDWRPINSFPNLQSLIDKIQSKNLSVTAEEIKEEIKIEQTSSQKSVSVSQDFNEFKFGKNANIEINYDELEKKYREENPEIERTSMEESSAKEENSKNNIGKTRVLKNSTNPKEVEKTIVINSKAMMPKKESTETKRKNTLAKQEKLNGKQEVEIYKSQEELISEKTEFINLSNILPTINAQLSVSEVELDQKAKIEENNERLRLKEKRQKLIQELESEEDNDQGEDAPTKPVKKKKRGMSIVVALAFMGVFYVLLTPEDKPKVSGPLFIDVQFPITAEYEDRNGASLSLSNARTLYNRNTYVSRALASKSYLDSLQKQFTSNEALGDLILTYSELLEDTKDQKHAGNIIYKLIQLAETKMLSDINAASGSALFFGKIGKYQTGVNIIKNYLRAKGPVSSKLLTYDLYLLMNTGDLVEARKVYVKLKETPKKPFEAYYHLALFDELDDQPANAREMINEGLKYYPDSVLLLLKQADYLFKDQSYKKFEEVLKKCFRLNNEGSPTLTAKFYYEMGLLSAMTKKNKEATHYFKKSLQIKESDDLRAMLSSLEIGGDKFSQSLILESKVLALLKKAKLELKNKNIEAAFSLSIEAIDASPEYVPAILFQVQLQLQRGLFESAINSLQKAIAQNPNNKTLKTYLISAYLKAFKLEDAQKMLIDLSQTKFSLTSEYSSMMGDFYQVKNNLQLASRWYNEALTRDPLSDYDLFQLTKILVRTKKFNEAKVRLAKALLLDPKNTEYLAMNAEILYEQDSTDTALGYLRDAISEIGEDPKLVSEIAKLYYRSGQVKEFQSYYKRIKEMPKKEEEFYEFLIYAAKLEEKKDEVIEYSRELLKLNPGNLKARLDLGEFFFLNKRYDEAVVEFNTVKENLSSYPKVHFHLARVYLAMNDIKKAKEYALKELALNPTLDSAYFIVGEVARIEKDYREAVFKYEKAISLNPKSVDALMALGWIRLSQNYASDALELYGKALKEDPNNPEIYKQLGFCYKAAGQRALAKEKLEDYMKLSPGANDKDQIETLIKSLQ